MHRRKTQVLCLCLISFLFLIACSVAGGNLEPVPSSVEPDPTRSINLSDLPVVEITQTTSADLSPTEIGGMIDSTEISPTEDRTTPVRQTPSPTFDPASWQRLPVMPHLSAHALKILHEGIALGNNPNAFSKVGDCESQTTWFLGSFDMGPDHYNLGPYQDDYAPVIETYAGSFNRLSIAAKQGFTAASLLSPLWSDRQNCQKNEPPLVCEYRLHRPSVAFIMVGTNDAVNPKTFEGHMRKVIEYSLSESVLPILGTKADNIEGDHSINQTIARLAYEYDVPLWNYWLAVQDLPGNGLQEDGAHLTYAGPFFDNPEVLKKAWPVRNLNALQLLNLIMSEIR